MGRETGWLVEAAQPSESNPGPHRYRTLEQGIPVWTTDPNKALRFARRVDAELFAAEDEDAWHIREHIWDDGAADEPKAPECERSCWLRDSYASVEAGGDPLPCAPEPPSTTHFEVNYQPALVFAVRELLGSLPKNRDWFNPDAEHIFREYLSDARQHIDVTAKAMNRGQAAQPRDDPARRRQCRQT